MTVPTFENKADLFKWLTANKSDLMEFKKSALKFSDALTTPTSEGAVKALATNNADDIEAGIIKRSIIGNTYNWLDSHGDVHVGNTFAKSINERANKIFHLHDHKHEVTAKVGRFTGIYEKSVSWADLGVNKAGSTTVLMADSTIQKALNSNVFKMYLDGEIDQHSVGMRYVKMDLAINDKDYPDELATWNKYIDQIGNRNKAEETGYFWAVSEAKLIEISAVLMGSNELTPTVENIEPSNDTQTAKEEPSNDTQIDWQQVVKNVKF
jgi:hypothetical protein